MKRYPWNGEHKPGTWKGLQVPIEGQPGKYIRKASLTCPECGRVSSLSDHTIDLEGLVQPSVVCPYEDCNFHEFIQLEGWDPNVK